MGIFALIAVISYGSKAEEQVVRPTDPEMLTDRKEDAVVLAKWKKWRRRKTKPAKKRTPFAKLKGVLEIYRIKKRRDVALVTSKLPLIEKNIRRF